MMVDSSLKMLEHQKVSSRKMVVLLLGLDGPLVSISKKQLRLLFQFSRIIIGA